MVHTNSKRLIVFFILSLLFTLIGAGVGIAERKHKAKATTAPKRGVAIIPFPLKGKVPAGGLTGQLLTKNSNTSYDYSWLAAGVGSGTVTSFSAGTLSPLFTTSVATATLTPALSFTLSTAGAHTFFGNNTGSTATPGFQSITAADVPTLNQATTANAGTATALAADGANCSAGSYPLGVDTLGAVQNCTVAPPGTVTTFSSGNLSPLFTSSVATATTTPAQTFALSTAAAHTFLGNNTGSTAAPAYATIGAADLPAVSALSGSVAAAQMPALTGDVTTSAGAVATTIATTVPNAHTFSGDITYSGKADKAGNASITADTSGINTTETVVVKSATALAANRLVVGSTIRAVLDGTCTSTAANVSTFAIRIGSAGTTSDAIVLSAPTTVAATTGTAIPFRVELDLVVRTTGASATAMGFMTLTNQGITGISATATQVVLPTMTTFNTTTASNIIDVTYKSAATTTTSTFKVAYIEVVYQ